MYYFAYGSNLSSNFIRDYTPSAYVDFMIEGAREHGLDVDYVENLVAIRNTLA